MTEQSNRAWMRRCWGNQTQHFLIIDRKAHPISGLSELADLDIQNAYIPAHGTPLVPTADQKRSSDWKRIQREKQESKRKARWRVFWNCLLAVPGCAVSLYVLLKLVEWIIR